MPTQRFLARPLKEVLKSVTAAVTESQTDLDRHSIAVQRELNEAIERGDLEYLLEATWFQFADVDVDVKIALELAVREEADVEGDMFYWPPGHTVRADEDTDFVLFSPQHEHGEVIDHIRNKMGESA